MNNDGSKQTIGKEGEDLACDYLASLGYRVLGRNIREKFGEIDILAEAADGCLHFVEVKTVSAGYADYSGMTPEDNLSPQKLGKMKKMAEWYANAHPEYISGEGWQIDLVAISVNDSGKEEKSSIKFYPNIA